MVKNRKRKLTVDTEFAAELIGEELKNDQLRTNPTKLQDDALFVEDAQPDNSQIALPVRRKRLRASKEKRQTRAQAIISAASPLPIATGGAYAKRKKRAASKAVTLPSRQLEKRDNDSPAERDLWTQEVREQGWVEEKVVATRPKSLDAKNRPRIEAVEVDPAGCSYNPDYGLHQDAVAVAVAAENLKLIDRELQPKAPPQSVTQADFDMKEMSLGHLLEEASDEEAQTDLSEGLEAVDGATGGAAQQPKPRTQKDRARQLAHKQAEAEVEARRSLKRLRRQLENVRGLQQEIEEETELKEGQLARKKADLEAKEAIEPPKLGRHKFVPLPVQVMASDDVSGSLRKLKTTPVVVKDRFKSFQKRGIIQVTVKTHWNKPTTRRVKQYEKGATMERDQEMQDAINRAQKKRVAARWWRQKFPSRVQSYTKSNVCDAQNQRNCPSDNCRPLPRL